MKSSTYDRLIDSGAILFAQKGFYGTSIRDIAEQVGISKQALLHHFATKEKLYGEVLARIADNLVTGLENIIGEKQSPREQIDIAIDKLFEWMSDDVDSARVLLRELLDNPERAPHAVNWYLNPLLEALTAIVKRGQKEGVFKKVSPLAFIYNILGAQHYFIVSLPTLKQMLSAQDYKILLKDQHKELKAMMISRLLVDN